MRPPPVYSGGLTLALLSPPCSHVMFAMMSGPDREAPDSVTVSGPLSGLREAMAEIFTEPAKALLSRTLVISGHLDTDFEWDPGHWVTSFSPVKESELLFHLPGFLRLSRG